MLANDLLWDALGLGLIFYVLTGGAGLGSGLWHVLARGPRKRRQRRVIETTMERVLEVNHVWLIVSLVLLFVAFPAGTRAIQRAVATPLAIAGLGIVLRGAAIAVGSATTGPARPRCFRLVEWLSVLIPIALGMSLTGLVTGTVDASAGRHVVPGWAQPFGWLVGLMVLALFALLAAVYLASDTMGSLAHDFRRRAIQCELVAGMLAAGALLRASLDAPVLHARLLASWWSLPIQILAAGSAVATIFFLWQGRFTRARMAAGLQVVLVVLGWGLAMDRQFLLSGPPPVGKTLPSAIALCILAGLPVLVFVVHAGLPMIRRFTRRTRPAVDAAG